ncbi:MAG: class I SAM-dependent methyltransferase, partial [Chroococcales cyanobacterium]
QRWLDAGVNLDWKSWAEIPENSIVGCWFSNELVDALPVHLVTVEGGMLKEVYVTVSDEHFVEVTGEISTPRLGEYFGEVGVNLPSKAYPNEYRTEVNLAALDWLETVSRRLRRGYLLTIDYGYPAFKYYHPQRHEGTLKCYYQHRHHNNPYVNVGSQDITAHVDFTALEVQGQSLGLEKVGFTKQGLFLMALGLGDRLSELSSGKLNLQEVLSRRNALHQLIDPTGLGGFGVLIQGKGLEERRFLRGLFQASF